jgi:hypothetical protein
MLSLPCHYILYLIIEKLEEKNVDGHHNQADDDEIFSPTLSDVYTMKVNKICQ